MIGVIGSGTWATAIVKILLEQEGRKVNWWVRNDEVRKGLEAEGRNPKYLPSVQLDSSRLNLSGNLAQIVAESGYLFLVIPSAYVASTLDQLPPIAYTGKKFISAIKGVIPDKHVSVSVYLENMLKVKRDDICVISGPTHAEEVGHNRLTYMTIASSNVAKARIVGEKLATPFLKVSYARNMRYLESSSVLKNIYAVIVGMAAGMGYGDNFISSLVSNCIKEMYLLLDPQSTNDITKFTPSSFFGDLLVSCYSSHSRNRQLGILIGRGNTVKTALNEMTMVAEGYFASAMMPYLTDAQRAQLPIAETAYQVLHQGMPARKAMKIIEDVLL